MPPDTIRVVLFGYGYWGRKLAAAIQTTPGLKLAAIIDPNIRDLPEPIAPLGPHLQWAMANGQWKMDNGQWKMGNGQWKMDNGQWPMENGQKPAAIIATPPHTHPELVSQALEAGLDVLCEKPLAPQADQARDLARRAKAARRLLMVDHIFTVNAGLRRFAAELFPHLEASACRYVCMEWCNFGRLRDDIDALSDLAPHPISVAHQLFGDPLSVQCRPVQVLEGRPPDACRLFLEFDPGLLVDVAISRLAHQKVRRITAHLPDRWLIFDDVLQEVYQQPHGKIDNSQPEIAIWPPPLRVVLESFAKAINGAPVPPHLSADAGVAVAETLEAARLSITKGCVRVRIS